MAGEVLFTPTEVDFVDANQDWYRLYLRSRRGWRAMLIQILICGAIGMLVGVVSGESAEVVAYMTLGLAALAAILLPVVNYLAMLLLTPRRARRLFRQQKTREEVKFSWSDEGVRFQSANGDGGLPWHDFYSIGLGRKAILLFMNEQLYHFLPRRAFGAGGDDDLAKTAFDQGVRSATSA